MTQPAPAPAPAPAPTFTPPAPAPAPPAPTDPGFPANTPVVQMTEGQQAAYWKHYARQHEDRNKAFGDLTPEQLTELRAAKERQDALELELGTTTDKAVAQAAKDAEVKARGELLPQVISARLDAAAARAGVADADLATALKFVDSSKFTKADGSLDADMVTEFIATIKPAVAPTAPTQQPRGPIITPHTPVGTAPVKPGDGARAALAARGITLPA